MSKQKMYMRMITASLMRRRSRMLVALLAIAVGATILSGLVTIYYDVPRQMGAQFRNYGANMIMVATENGKTVTEDMMNSALEVIPEENIVGVAPYSYVTVRMRNIPIIAAATDLASAQKTSPYWFVTGEWPSASGEIMFGEEVAESLGMSIGDTIEVTFTPEITTGSAESTSGGDTADDESTADADTADGSAADEDTNIYMDFTVTGILDTGGNEEGYVFISLEDMALLTESEVTYDVVELSVSASSEELSSYVDEISALDAGVSSRLVKRVTQSETTVLTKLQALVLLVTIIVLMLTMICVATTMMAVATERRKEIGLRKALGAPNSSIVAEFMGEAILLGGIGGLVGSGLGFVFAELVSVNVFNSSINFQPALVPITIIVSVAITALSCMIPVRNATQVDPAIVLKGE